MSNVFSQIRPWSFTLRITIPLGWTTWLHQLTVSESNSGHCHCLESNLVLTPRAEAQTINHFTSIKWNLWLPWCSLEFWNTSKRDSMCVSHWRLVIFWSKFYIGVSFDVLNYGTRTAGFMCLLDSWMCLRHLELIFLGNTFRDTKILINFIVLQSPLLHAIPHGIGRRNTRVFVNSCQWLAGSLWCLSQWSVGKGKAY